MVVWEFWSDGADGVPVLEEIGGYAGECVCWCDGVEEGEGVGVLGMEVIVDVVVFVCAGQPLRSMCQLGIAG